VDTGPVVERVAAKYAGLGWLAKNTCLIHEESGSWLFLGVIVTTLDLAASLGPAEVPAADLCGNCRLCIEACPTAAIVEPYILDARRCISYLTIELRGAIPVELREPMGRHVFGCDICQDVCPWNRGIEKRRAGQSVPAGAEPHVRLADWLQGDGPALTQRYERLYVPKNDARYLRRNALVALGNTGEVADLPLAETFLEGDDELLREQAEWAVRRIAERNAG
jgi:epoxyqueuosine reductase